MVAIVSHRLTESIRETFNGLKEAGLIGDITWSIDNGEPPKFKPNGEKLSDCYKTPLNLYETLKEEFPFTLDAAADDENHLCDEYFTYETNGLEQDWLGHDYVFVNPPYSEAAKWVKKASEESKKGIHVVMVLNVASGTKYWADYIWEKTGKPWALKPRENVEVRFMKHRIRFVPPPPLKESSPRFENCIVVFYPS